MTPTLSLITPSDTDGCATYRSIGPLNALAPDAPYVVNPLLPFLSPNPILFQRPWHISHLDLIITARHIHPNRPIIIDFDDDMTALPKTNPHYDTYSEDNQTHAIAALADTIIVSTKAIADSIIPHIDNQATHVHIIKNAIDPAFRNQYNAPLDRRPIVVWRGSSTHEADILSNLTLFAHPLITPNHQLICIGAPPPLSFPFPHTHIPALPYEQYMTFLQLTRPEFFVIPLEEHAFNRAKSDVCAQEAFACGARIIHSGVGEYARYPQGHWEEPRWLDQPDINPIRRSILYGN